MIENGKLMTLNIDDILPNRFQPRIYFNENNLNELAQSIHKYGVIQPIIVRPVNNKYEIIAGERRYKASKIANKQTIPAIVVNLTDRESEEIALLENAQRRDLTSIEEAVSYKRILDMGYINKEELAKNIGKSENIITGKVNLLDLDDSVGEALLYGKISEGHARSLLKLKDRRLQREMLDRIIKERLTVKKLDEEIAKISNNNEIETLFIEERKDNMDIDKIMREAKDINAPQNPNNVDMLMQNPNVTPAPVITPAPTEDPLAGNKFVHYTVEEEKKPEETPAPANNATFDSMFNPSPNVLTPSDVQNVSSAVSEAFKANENVVNNQNISMPNYIPEETPAPTMPSTPTVQEIPTYIEPTMPPANNQMNSAQNIMPNNAQVNMPNQMQTNMPSSDIYESEIPLPVSSQEPEVKKNIVDVIHLIRECANKIEALGYVINVDEADLTDSYQVTFKVEK